MNAIIALLAGLMISFIANTFYFVTEIILITENLLPTDPLHGILDVDTELFTAYLPYINWFVPLDYAVLLFGSFVQAYGLYITYKYFKKIISSILGNPKNILGSLSQILK